MKKETLTEKLIKRIYGISGPLDEHKRREADRIGNQVFIVLFYLMTFGNLIPFVLAYKYPQIVAIGYPLVVFGISMMAALYVVSQTKKTGITAIDPEMLSQKESKQLYFPGLKAGLIYGMGMFFGIPLLNVLTDDSKDYLGSLLNAGHFVSTILATFFFGLTIQITSLFAFKKPRKTKKTTRGCLMKSLARLLISHVFISIFVTFFLLSGHIEHPFLIIFLLFLPVLNKGQRFQKIQSKKIRLLNASLCFILVSFPQLLTNPMDWRYLVFLIICIIFSLVYFYTLYQLFKEVNQKSLI